MAGCGQHIDLIGGTVNSFPASNFVPDILKDTDHDPIGIIIIIAVLGSVITDEITDHVIPCEVSFNGIDKFLHRHPFLIKDIVLDGCYGICDGANPYDLDIAGVILGSTCIVISAALPAPVHHDGHQR